METSRHHAEEANLFEYGTKRRKIRKGTTSCWTCKKRKVKCIFTGSDAVCEACRRRDTPCVLQDEPEESIYDRRNTDGQLPTPSPAAPTPEQTVFVADNESISHSLRQAFPLQHDIDIVCGSDRIPTLFCYHYLMGSRDGSEYDARAFADELATIPDPTTTPPILMAKQMLLLALMFQYLHCSQTERLSEHPMVITNRLVESVVQLVTSNDRLVGCIEGVECIASEALFQSNCGNLRRAWIGFRRAMVFAQLMKLDLPDPPPVKYIDAKRRVDPKYLWLRIVHSDSYLSLMLGLAHGGQASTLQPTIPTEPPTCKIARAHTRVACRIIDRNRHKPQDDYIDITRALDQELLCIARSLPYKYWLLPNVTTLHPNTEEAFQELVRLRDQLCHYNLLHLLHLPFLLRCGKDSEFNMYSKITCINASRDVLSRFMAFQNFRPIVTQACHSANFFALMASITILIAHIDSYRWDQDSFLMHQRLSDRAMVEQLVEGLEQLAESANNLLTSRSAAQLRCLLEIENEAARGKKGHTGATTLTRLQQQCGNHCSLAIPYFGIIKIGSDGITKQQQQQQPPPCQNAAYSPSAAQVFPPTTTSIEDTFSGLVQSPGSTDMSGFSPSALEAESLQTPLLGLDSTGDSGEIRQSEYPDLTAGADDWAFQGVDAAFFDSLISGSNWNQTAQAELGVS
ncbi:uncharacterized protein SETTUDRAFT_89557 [Exserohilum turcica Et28A]|uniref:Zn(2)-C6 fungal-type domain-containing protein n=1 Tax=Exserohilum turcicum (strain 28A) TaxID=671987 RepID=R0KBR6_EXST2|nr:uncharacterized protein SETTUDRAFT_89557 [Exserohilum turcica Et28A]EOA86844.1 hypothetical protein SETTUDRAFT_89557 [Exserohilum turcica Et28A]